MHLAANTRACLRITHHCAAPPGRVFDAWLAPQLAGQWLFATASRPMAHVLVDARSGGAFRFIERRSEYGNGINIQHRGRYVEIKRPQRLVFTLHSPDCAPHATHIAVEFRPQRNGCELLLEHDDVPPQQIARVEARWLGMFYGLDTVLAQQRARYVVIN